MILNSSRLQAPCKGCDERELGCHSKCEKYITFRSALDKENEERYNAKQLYMTLNQIEVDRVTAVVNGKMHRRKKKT